MELKLDMLQTVALAVVVYYLGVFIKSKVKVLDEFCIPSPVVGGIVFAVLNLLLRQFNIMTITLDATLKTPFMLVFFTTIGLSANLKLIKEGGLIVLKFFLVSVILVLCQDIFGMAIAKLIGQDPLLGLLGGSITMVGGHATGLAFGELFEKSYGFAGATTIAMASATFGLVSGSLMGGPLGKRLVDKNNLVTKKDLEFKEVVVDTTPKEKVNFEEIFKMFTIIMISIALGSVLEKFFISLGLTLPSYVTAMIIAAIILNVGEGTKTLTINKEATSVLGDVGLNVFLSMALIDLRLWELKEVAGPILIILVVQCIIMATIAYFLAFRFCGKDYDAAVMASGFCGFGMGATPNGMANMSAMKMKYGPAPRAFFVLPIVGAFFIDFTNSILITIFVNFIR